MAFQITTSILIPASTHQVWAELTNFEAYPEWNPFITKATGQWVPGNKIAVTAGGMDFQPTVLAFSSGKELRWLGSFLFKGILDGEHYFRLVDNGDGTTTLEHGEHFRGILTPVLKGMLMEKTSAGFRAMNEALAARLVD